VFFKDDGLRSLRLSKNYETMLGKPFSELLGKTMDELFPSDFAKNMIADDIKIMKEGRQVTIEEEFNGRIYQTIKFPISHMGMSKYLAGYSIDITERKKAESQLTEQIAELQRWHNITLCREGRVLELKREVNELLRMANQPLRYPSAEVEVKAEKGT
jgi:PAS domain S-box-containing protein